MCQNFLRICKNFWQLGAGDELADAPAWLKTAAQRVAVLHKNSE